MSLEWARARALQNEARLRESAKSAGREGWPEVKVFPATVTVWVEPARMAGAIARAEGELLHKSMNREDFHE
jgi:hypothetical protein